MQFDKPKVTIDLEEYQHLKEQVLQLEKERNSDGYYDVARMIFFAFSTHNRSVGDMKSYLAHNGVTYFIAPNSTRSASYEDIHINFEPKNK